MLCLFQTLVFRLRDGADPDMSARYHFIIIKDAIDGLMNHSNSKSNTTEADAEIKVEKVEEKIKLEEDHVSLDVPKVKEETLSDLDSLRM